MKEFQKVDLGSIQIHKYVIADIAANAIADVKGLKLAGSDIVGTIQELLGIKKYPAISVCVDKNNQVSIDVKVVIEYGLSIPDVAAKAQDLIREAIERAADIDLKDVNINIRGIERHPQDA
jgi:uncharacterized alkaline shock family protein YloU